MTAAPARAIFPAPSVSSSPAPPVSSRSAVAQRLRAAADAVLTEPPAPHPDPDRDADACLTALVDRLAADHDPALAWLLLATLAAGYPSADDVRAVVRAIDLDGPVELTLRLLDRAREVAVRCGTPDRTATVVSGVVLDVDMCARFDFHNGIQRVAREVAREWTVAHDVTLTAWTSTAGALRLLTPAEEDRAARWGEAPRTPPRTAHAGAGATGSTAEDAAEGTDLVLPWRAVMVLPEVPLPDDRCARLAALAQLSGSRICAIGYDAIPVISADLRPVGEPNGFTAYLTVIKHSARVAGISSSAAAEFQGFAAAVTAQGLAGPRVSEVVLPVTVPPAPAGYTRHEPARPLVLSVGRLEPHKNHGALLHAAERLWAQGVDFELCLVGGPGWDSDRVEAQLRRLGRAGAPVSWRRSVGDDELWTLMRDASCTAFLSLHEGFGLPVAESLACGTPVLTTRYGSQGQIAEGGGCLTVDPRDDESVLAGLRDIVTRPDLRARLRQEAAARPLRTWGDYTRELWHDLVEEGSR